MSENPTTPATTSVPDNPPTTGSAADAAPVDHAPTEVDHEGTGPGDTEQEKVDGSDNA